MFRFSKEQSTGKDSHFRKANDNQLQSGKYIMLDELKLSVLLATLRCFKPEPLLVEDLDARRQKNKQHKHTRPSTCCCHRTATKSHYYMYESNPGVVCNII